MLQNIRERFTGRFALVVLALICLPFLFFGVPNDFIATEDVASVDDTNISQPYFENQYQNEMLRYDSEGIEIPDEARIFVRQNVLNNIINDVLTEKFINENGINISDEFIARVIQSSPEFMIDGQFSRDRYYTWLNERVIEPSLFEENQRINIRKGQLERGIRATSFVTPSEYRRYLNLVGEQRNVTIAEIDQLRRAVRLDLVGLDGMPVSFIHHRGRKDIAGRGDAGDVPVGGRHLGAVEGRVERLGGEGRACADDQGCKRKSDNLLHQVCPWEVSAFSFTGKDHPFPRSHSSP